MGNTEGTTSFPPEFVVTISIPFMLIVLGRGLSVDIGSPHMIVKRGRGREEGNGEKRVSCAWSL